MAIQKNLTPFYWGPKATSRRPPQVEMAVCVRGVFRLEPGKPLEVISDEIDQGFMSGATWAEDDPDRLGRILRHSDFADWKPHTDLLLKGTCYPPNGRDVVCDVAWAVGGWAKKLRVYGPRIYTPGMLFGGSVSDPQTFTRMPLTWENAYGGPGYGPNPVGKGFASPLMPTVEDPKHPLTKIGAKGVVPATFLPISPQWPQRWGKVGKNYGAEWEKTRAPFVSDDFDWTHFNAAPPDQQLQGYLRGDESLRFQNLHPKVPRFEVRLPGLRIRALVKTDDGLVHDLVFALDTLFADMDAGRLELTWRALTPIRELDMTDVTVVLVASEQLSEEPLPAEHYRRMLEEFEDDPVGIKTAFPPGFMQVAEALKAADKADLEGTPRPDFVKLAESLPADSFVKPWCVAALGCKDDPGKIMQMAAEASGGSYPLAGLELEELERLKNRSPEEVAEELEALSQRVDPSLGEPLANAAAKMRMAAKLNGAGSDGPLTALEKVASVLPPAAAAAVNEARAKLQSGLSVAAEHGGVLAPPQSGPTVAARLASVEGAPSLDDAVGKALAPLDGVQLPKVPALPKIADGMGWMESCEAMWRRRIGDHPLLKLFDMGRRAVARGDAKLASIVLDTSPVLESLDKAEGALLGVGVSAAAFAPLTRFKGRFEAMLMTLPGAQARAEERDYASQALDGHDFSGQDLSGKSFVRASLKGARFAGAILSEADFTDADLAGADLTGAGLTGAVLRRAKLDGATLDRAVLSGADLEGATLSEASAAGVNLQDAKLVGAMFEKANLEGADLSRAHADEVVLTEANLRGARLDDARLEQAIAVQAQLQGASLTRAKCSMAIFIKADLTGADLSESELSMALFRLVRGEGLNLRGASFDMGKLDGSKLCGADLREARSSLGSMTGCDLTGADLRGAGLHKVDMSEAILDRADLRGARLEVDLMKVMATETVFEGADLQGLTAIKATFSDCNFRGVSGPRSTWMEADLSRSDFSHAKLPHALFQSARGEGVRFYAADLKHASFRGAELSGSAFVGADLCLGDLNNSKLTDVQFTSANCYDTKFMDAKLTTCDFLEASLYRARFDRTEGAPA